MSSPSFDQWKPIFVSYNGDAVLQTFMSPLFKRLKQAGIGYFTPNYTEDAGLLKEILIQAGFALVVFSESYAESNQHLDELVDILKCKKYNDLVVIPIFYMNKAVVSNLARDGEFQEALGNMEQPERDAKKMVWRSALAEAKEKSGYELRANNGPRSPDDSKLMEIIFERLVNKIHSLYSNKVFTFGPFGDTGRRYWQSGTINGIAVEYGDYINSITFKVDDDTRTVPTEFGRESPFEVRLEQREYITSFAGYFEKVEGNLIRIKSLKFQTNKRILGPIGRVKEETKEEEEKKYFSVPSKGGEVIEFFGRKNGFLTSIGARVKLHSEKFRPVSVERVGFIGHESRLRWDDGNQHTNVRKIIAKLDSSGVDPKKQFIRSIEFHYEEKDRESWPSERHGCMDGDNLPLIRDFDLCPDEYLTLISGFHTEEGIKSLTFGTNKKRTITFGGVEDGIDVEGAQFSSPATDEKIVGFYGWTYRRLYGIGAYVERKPIGGGEAWGDGTFDGVREIHYPRDIRYINFVYDDGSGKGHTFARGDYKGENSREAEKIKLDYPCEYLISISGYTGEDGAIKSLTFYSNKKIHNLYGESRGKYFCYPSTGSRITGFYGTWDKALNAIGVYAEPIPHMYPFKIEGPYGGSGDTLWDDGVHTNVRAFHVTTSETGKSRKIKSIAFMYDDNGSLVEGSRHGRGDPGDWIWLDFPHERLTSISVWKGSNGDESIRGLEITTIRGPSAAKQTYPYGQCPKDPGMPVENVNKKDDHKIVGFFGSVGPHLISIGAHLEKKSD